MQQHTQRSGIPKSMLWERIIRIRELTSVFYMLEVTGFFGIETVVGAETDTGKPVRYLDTKTGIEHQSGLKGAESGKWPYSGRICDCVSTVRILAKAKVWWWS